MNFNKNTQKILDKIDLEMSKMLGKSKTKMTNEEFRAFVTQEWEKMDTDKYQIHDAYILIGRMMNEAVWAKDPADLVKWIQENQKHQSAKKNSIDVVYNYYANHFTECQAFAEGLDFFKNEAKQHSEATDFVNLFDNLMNDPEARQMLIEDDDDEIDMGFAIELAEWAAFFGEDETELGYEILKKDGDITERHSKQHKAGLNYLKEHQQAILNAILGELLKQYPQLQQRYNYQGEAKDELMPDVSDISGFASLLSPTRMYLFSKYKDDLPYIGIEFHCSWDSKHGLGVIIHKDSVIKMDDASLAFDIYAIES